jgi:hypothetical protein
MLQSPFKYRENLSHGTGRDRRISWFALATIVGVLYFITAVAVLHALRPDLNPVTHAVSNYAVGPFAFLMISAFFVLAFSEFALAQGLARVLAKSGRVTTSIVLLNLAAFGLIVTGIFRSDVNVPRPPASPGAVVHWTAAGISFLSLMIAIFLLTGCFKRDVQWQPMYRLSYAWLVAIVLALTGYGTLSLVDWTGIGERIFLATCILWLLFVSLRLRAITIY